MLRMTPLPARHDPRRFRCASNCFWRWFVLVAVPLPRVYFPPTYAMHFAVGCVLVSGSAAATMPEASAKRSFDLPAGEAAAVFKQFIAQSRVQLLYVADDATSVRTNTVKGAFTPREAIDRILAGTSLIAVQTDSGSIAVKKLAPQVRPGISPTPISPPANPAKPTANPRNQTNAPLTPMKSPKLLSILSLLAFGAAESSAQSAPVAPATSETVELSPFMVTSEKDAGYYGANSMSGTRMNTKLEDIAASITVITKQQMMDLALLNMDDIFSYEASTEGTRNYTAFSFDRNQVAIDNTRYAKIGLQGSLREIDSSEEELKAELETVLGRIRAMQSKHKGVERVKSLLIQHKKIRGRIETLQRKREVLNNHMETLENSELNQQVLYSMQRTSHALKAMGLDKSLQSVDQVMLDLEENHNDMNSLQHSLGTGYADDEETDWGLELNRIMHDDCYVEQPEVCNSTRPRNAKAAPVQASTEAAAAQASTQASTPAEDVFVDVQEDLAGPAEAEAAVKKTEHAVIA